MTTEPRWLSDEEQAFWRLLLAARRTLDRVVDTALDESADLSSPEFSVLVALSEADERRLRLRELCAELGWDRSRTSHQITRMERRGLVSKEKSPGDARGVVVCLTDTGMTHLEQAAPDHVETVRRAVFDHLAPADVPAIARFFEGILAAGDGTDAPCCAD